MIEEKSFNLKRDFPLNIPQMDLLYQNLFSRGKTLRATMTSHVADCLNISKEKSDKLGKIVEYIHQSSILHDDVIDASPIRRGALSSWMQYSVRKAVLAGDYLLAQAAEHTAEMNNIALMKLTANVLKQLVEGEWLQSSLKKRESMPELDRVSKLKTASLFQWSLRAPFLIVNRYERELHHCLDQIGALMGVLFQRADDLLDFDIRNKENKALFKDMEEGYFNSFAVYLSEGKDPHFRSQLRACRSLKEVKVLFRDQEFKDILNSFDEENKKKIRDCQNEIEHSLKLKLLKSEQSLIDQLKPWPWRFYWRQNV
ncbi:MAG: polyprenyl synthetase family protein [Bdellovibrionales bacterium]|nr:polyprenyl synthetase family protein [Bdellovibrionales bacterium]